MNVFAAAFVLGFALQASPVRAAENASAEPAAKAEPAAAAPDAARAPKPDPAARVDELEKMVLQLQSELADVKKQLSASPTVPPAAKAMEVSSVPAASPASSPSPSRAWAGSSRLRRNISRSSPTSFATMAGCSSPTKFKRDSDAQAKNGSASSNGRSSRLSSPAPKASLRF